MKIKRLSGNFTSLEKNQMKAIDELQDKLKLIEFDRNRDRQTIQYLRLTLKRKKEVVNSVIQELEMMKKENNYNRLQTMINVLKGVSREGYNE